MTVELFWEALLLGNKKSSGEKKSNNLFTVVYSGSLCPKSTVGINVQNTVLPLQREPCNMQILTKSCEELVLRMGGL